MRNHLNVKPETRDHRGMVSRRSMLTCQPGHQLAKEVRKQERDFFLNSIIRDYHGTGNMICEPERKLASTSNRQSRPELRKQGG